MKLFSRKTSDNLLKRSPLSTKENSFKYPEVRRKESSKPLQVHTNHSDMRSPSAQSTQSNKSILITHRSQSMFQDAQYIDYIITNREVNSFLKKHFLHEQQHFQTNSSNRGGGRLICDSWDKVPIAYFIKALFSEYPEIIQDHQLNEKLNAKLKTLIKDLVSEDGQFLSLNKLQIHTRHLGLLGLLLTALRDIQDQPTINTITEENIYNSNQPEQILQKCGQELLNQAETKINELINTRVSALQNKLILVERQLQKVKQQDLDLFQHETKNKNIINTLKTQLIQKDKIIAELEQKLLQKQVSSSIDEDTSKCFKASPIRMQSPSQSPFNNNNEQQSQSKLLTYLMNCWDMGSLNEDYRFAQILTAQENNQMPFQNFQLIPIIKTLPGFSEFCIKSQNSMHIITNFIQCCLMNESINNSILDLYNDLLMLMPTLKSQDETHTYGILNLFLKTTTVILHIKSTFQIQQLKEWLQLKRQLNDSQQQFLKNLIAQLIQISQFTMRHVPQSKLWQDYTQTIQSISHPIIENAIVMNVLKKCFISLSQMKTKSSIIAKFLMIFYHNDFEMLSQLMHSIQAETESDLFIAKVFLDTDCVNLLLFPSLNIQVYTLSSLNNLLQFRCPAQYYQQFTKQVCNTKNIESLCDLLARSHNCQGEITIKAWDVLGAISKSISLRECSQPLQFVIRLYQHNPQIQKNIQAIQKNLVNGIPI